MNYNNLLRVARRRFFGVSWRHCYKVHRRLLGHCGPILVGLRLLNVYTLKHTLYFKILLVRGTKRLRFPS